ncbi:unnamed protein product, partial [Mesorhabditis spiculigera]
MEWLQHIYMFAQLLYMGSADLGGMLCRLPKDVGYACGRLSSSTAYYFDSTEGKCLSFVFHGCGGNQNRFINKQECVDGCAALTRCGKGLPLMDFAGNIKRCDGDKIPCPGTHECHGAGMSSVCCIKPERVCHLPIDNGNRCGVAPDTRFYFDSDSNTCRSFSYVGCGGNDNNFKTKGECLQYCSTEVVCKRGDPLPDRYSIAKQMSCSRGSPCPSNYTCIKATSGNSACCPSQEMVCGATYNPREVCRNPLDNELWTFEHKKGRCEKIPQKPHINHHTAQPQLCDKSKRNSCPVGYECMKSSPFAAICCRSQPICPGAESILQTGGKCEEGRAESCASGYTCQQAPNREFVCCTPTLQCPSGMEALRDGGRARICTPRVEGSCPSSHVCVVGSSPPSPGFRPKTLCCRPLQRCVVPYVESLTKKTKRCFPGENKCPSATHCLPVAEPTESLLNIKELTFYCCHTVDVFSCSSGLQPLEDRSTKRPIKCEVADPNSCPNEHFCDVLADGTTACCPFEATQQTCVEALTNYGDPITCKGWDDPSCGHDSKCRKATDGHYVCCREVSSIFKELAQNAPFILF